MNNLIQNYSWKIDRKFSHIESFSQVRHTKRPNLELVALNITAEYMLYNSELQLFRAIKGTELENKTERSVYNKRRRKLVGYTEKIRQSLSQKFAHLSNLFSLIRRLCKYAKTAVQNALIFVQHTKHNRLSDIVPRSTHTTSDINCT